MGWAQDQGCARDTVSSLAKGCCSPGVSKPWWCFMVPSSDPQLISAARGNPAKTLHPQQHGQGHLLPCHVPLLPVHPSAGAGCVSLPLAGTPRCSLCVGQCIIKPPATPSGDFLSSSVSVLQPWRIPVRHHCALVALTAVQFSCNGYLCVPFNYFKIHSVYLWNKLPDVP